MYSMYICIRMYICLESMYVCMYVCMCYVIGTHAVYISSYIPFLISALSKGVGRREDCEAGCEM